jgi:beta,beta-carotene 9',10'-dioxygenase
MNAVTSDTEAKRAATRTPGPTAGFRTLPVERELDSLEVSGALPSWLTGSLLRIGPAKFEAGERSVNHWLDGFSMLHRFTLADGRISYANRFLETRAYRAASERGEIAYSEFATDPCRSLFKRVQAFFTPRISDNANVNVSRLGDQVVAMTETPLPIIFDPATLRAAGVASKAPGEHTTAHPHLDPATGEGLFYAVKFGARSTYRLYGRADARRQREIARLPAPRPAYMHSFGITERHAVLAECPLLVNPLDLVLSGRPFIENYRWRPERGTRFLVIDRRSGELAATVEAESFFCFHHVNAFEDRDELVVDLTAYADDEVVRAFYLERLRAGAPIPPPELRRYRVPLNGGDARGETLAAGFELPRVNYRRVNGRPYRYAYGNGQARAGGFLETVQKIDLDSGGVSEWSEPGRYPGEPVFVAAPEARAEDDGVVLSLVLDSGAERSFLLVLNARDLSELARAQAPHAVPFGFHGQFLRA